MRIAENTTAAGITAVVFLGLGFGLWSVVPPNASKGSITYLFLGLGTAAACLLFFAAAEGLLGLKRFPVFSTLGRNSLLMFMLAAVITKVLNALLGEDAGAPMVLGLAVLLEGICVAVAAILDHRRVYVKL